MLEVSSVVDNVQLGLFSWKNNKLVILVSDYIGVNPISKIKRRKEGTADINLDCPQVVKEYNKFMGGVDLLDSFMARHKFTLKSRKWYMRVFNHLLDMTVSLLAIHGYWKSIQKIDLEWPVTDFFFQWKTLVYIFDKIFFLILL